LGERVHDLVLPFAGEVLLGSLQAHPFG
jgi:hypothetical protein